MTRLLGIDLGERRIGLAIADDDGTPARPLATVRRARSIDGDVETIGRVVAEHRIAALVVGHPLEASGEVGPQAALTQDWAWAVAERLGLPVALRDERLSSHVAEGRLGPMKRGRSGGPPTASQREAYRSRVDREAAAIILQAELDARAAVPYADPRAPRSIGDQRLSIRSGGRPRGERPPPRYDPDAYATKSIPRFSEPYPRGGRNGRNGGGRGGGIAGFLKFLVFALVLAGLVVVVLLTALRPLATRAVLSWASDNPGAMSFPFVKELVREDLGRALTSPASSNDEQVGFVINPGDNATSIARRLERQDFLTDSRAFVFIALERELTGSLKSGEFILRRNLTPDELVTALLDPPSIQYVDIDLRTGLRLEQISAKLQIVEGLTMDPAEFYELASEPPEILIDDYPWLGRALDQAGDGVPPTLEGFLWPATYRVLPDTTPDELVRLMLDKFIETVGEERLTVAQDRGLTFYQVLVLASIVEREAVVPEEKPLIAGVYQNRIDGLPGVKNKILNADPTVIYAADTAALRDLPFEEWPTYSFWGVPEAPMAEVAAPGGPARLPDIWPARSRPVADLHADRWIDRRGTRPEHRGQVHLLSRDPRQWRHARVREDGRGAPGKPREVRLQLVLDRLPEPADFADPPNAAQRDAWEESDRAARPARLERLRARFDDAGIDAYFGVRREHMRYLTGFTLAEGEEKSAGSSGQFVVSCEETVVLADSRYTIQARREAAGSRLFEAYGDLPARWPELLASVGARRVAVEAGFVSQATWTRLAEAAPDVELVPVEGWLEADRATKEPGELERVAAACAVADRALATLLPKIRPGVTEATLALELEWLMRTNGAEALAFDVACLAGPEAALPHGAPGDRPVLEGSVLLFDFGAQVAGYRSDMTRTLFIGEPTRRDLDVYELVARAQQAAIDAVEAAVSTTARDGSPLPSGRSIDAVARTVIEEGGHGEHFGHGHGARHRSRYARAARSGPLCSRAAAPGTDRLLGRARGVPRWRDGRPHRGSRRDRRVSRAHGAPDPVPARHSRRGPVGSGRCARGTSARSSLQSWSSSPPAERPRSRSPTHSSASAWPRRCASDCSRRPAARSPAAPRSAPTSDARTPSATIDRARPASRSPSPTVRPLTTPRVGPQVAVGQLQRRRNRSPSQRRRRCRAPELDGPSARIQPFQLPSPSPVRASRLLRPAGRHPRSPAS